MQGKRLWLLGSLLVWLTFVASVPALAELKFFVTTAASINLSECIVKAGEPVTLTGTVSAGIGIPVTGGSVEIQMADAPEGPWTVLAQGEPDSLGKFQAADYSLGLERGPLYLRARYRGHDGGRMVFSESTSPAIPLIVDNGSAPGEELAIGFVQARGDGALGLEGLGPREFLMKVRALKEVSGVVFQGSTGDWLPLEGGTWDFQATAGRIVTRVSEDESGETLVSWHLGCLKAGAEATLRIVVDGIIPEAEAGCDTALPLGGLWVPAYLAEGRVPLTGAVSCEPAYVAITCP